MGTGSARSFRAPRLYVRFGYAGGLDARLNDRALRLPPGAYSALITPRGLSPPSPPAELGSGQAVGGVQPVSNGRYSWPASDEGGLDHDFNRRTGICPQAAVPGSLERRARVLPARRAGCARIICLAFDSVNGEDFLEVTKWTSAAFIARGIAKAGRIPRRG